MLSNILYRLNRINPNKPKTDFFKLAKIFLTILITVSVALKVIPIIAQDITEDIATEDEISTAEYDEFVGQIQEAKRNISAENWNSNMFNTTTVNICDILTGQCPTTESIQQSISQNGMYIPGGILGTTNNLIAQTYHQPASGIQYLAQLKDNLLGKPAYAQGVGFVGLEPLLPIWRGFRNIIYLLSSVFFIAIGVMVILRIKVNPQTVLSVQNAIPKIITTLLLVTFSYAIAGLLIDLTYIIQSVVLVLLFGVQNKGLNQNLFNQITVGTILQQYTFKNLSDANLRDVLNLTRLAVPTNLIFILGAILGALIGGVVAVLSSNPLFVAVGAGTGGLLFLIIINIIILIALTKFFFGIVKAYVNVIFKIILGPLEIGLGAIPGMKIGFSSWANNLFANLLIFPICLIFLVLANIIIEKTSFTSGLWAPNMIKYNIPGTLTSLATGVSGGLVPVAVGFMSIMLMSKLPEIIPQVFFAIKPSGFEQAIGQTLSENAFTKKILPLGKSIVAHRAANIVEEGAASSSSKIGRAAAKIQTRLGLDDDESRKAVGDSIRSIFGKG